MAQVNLSMKQTHTESRLTVARKGDREGWNGGVGLADAVIKILLPDAIICRMVKQQ